MKALAVQTSAIESALIQNDLSKLSEKDRLAYYKNVCESLGLNPLTQPFAYINLSGKLTLYAKRDAADQLRKINKVSIEITRQEKVGDIFMVNAKATLPDGRTDESTGAVNVANLKGEALANAYLKCETKAKRRVTLSICGLGFLDETEADSIPDARLVEDDSLKKLESKKPFNFAPGADNSNIPEALEGEDPIEAIGNMTCPFGRKFKGQRIKDIKANQLLDYISWLKNTAHEQGKELQGEVKDFVEASSAWLNAGNM